MAKETFTLIEETDTGVTIQTEIENPNYQSRWKSPVLWLALVGQLIAILLMLGVMDEAMGQQVSQIAAAVIQMLVMIGILNDPTDKVDW